MKILLDECAPRKFGAYLPDHEVKTVVQAGWKGIENGALLRKAAGEFDLFISVDRNLAFQQNPDKLPLPIIVIHSSSIKLNDLKRFIPEIQEILKKPLSKAFYHIGV